MLVTLSNVSAKSFGQNVNLNLKNTSIEKALELIGEQSGYSFLYKKADLPKDKSISVRVVNASVEDALRECLKNQPLTYRVFQQTIVLKRQQATTAASDLKAIEVRGIVTDSKGEALPGVGINIKGTSVSTVTDATGTYSINAPDGSYSIVFTFIGFATQEVAINDRSTINVTMIEAVSELSDVVIVGYGTQNRGDLSGSVVSVKAKDLNTVNAVSVDNLLQGRVAGLNVSTYTAQPGGGIDINIRGSISPLGGNKPLYVIDGVQITNNSSTDFNARGGTAMRGSIDRNPLNNINPNDIESITVLKDASATAIYGSAAANGVILITTKKGVDGKLTVNYDASYGVQRMAPYIEVFNARDFMINANRFGAERRLFDNNYAPFYGKAVDNGANPYVPKFSDQQIANAGDGFNWIDHMTRDGAVSNHNVSLSGGNKNTKVYSSLNYFNQKGILANSAMKRLVGRVNLEQKFTDRITLSTALSYSQINNNNVATGDQSGTQQNSPSLLRSAMAFAPTVMPYNDRGEINLSFDPRVNNPEGYYLMNNTSQNKRLFVAPKLEVKVLSDLKLNIVGGLDQTSTTADFFIPRKARFDQSPTGNAEVGFQAINNYTAETYLNYDKSFVDNKHKFSAVLGAGYYNTTGNYFGVTAVDFPTDQFGTANLAIAANKLLTQPNSYVSQPIRKVSQFARLNYTLDNKYIIDLTGRRDGSSKFGSNKRYGFFPGASVAWKVSNEDFFSSFLGTVSELKIRTSYGTSGNDNIAGNQSVSLYGPGYATAPWNFLFGNDINTGVLQTQLGNPDISWETNITFNAGVDFGLFKNRVTGSFEYFNRTAKDLLDFGMLNINSPVSRIGINIGSTRSTGVEFALNTQNIKNKSFSWNSNVTVGTYKAKWVERNPDVNLVSYIKVDDPIRAVYGWKTNGILRTPADLQAVATTQPNAVLGNLRYVDANNDNKLDVGDVVSLGDINARVNFGFNNTFSVKGFDLSAFIYGNFGGVAWDGWQTFNRSFDLGSPTPINSSVRTTDVFTSFNTNAKYPSIAINPSNGSNPSGVNDFTMKEIYFFRLKNLTLGYTLPNKLLGDKKIFQSVRLYVDAANLGVLTNFEGLDPEMERHNGPYPIARTFSFGFNSRF
jgi:TonB-linked SusC/RagA family outer membrane protein